MATPKQISIKSVIRKINRSFFIPDIQRSYVWLQNYKDRKIERLFDSLMRGYPIGAFLFWSLEKRDVESGEVNFQLYKFIENYDVRSHHNEKIDIGNVDAGELAVVLDGQQRLTSLFIGLRGSRTLRRPYAKGEGASSYPEKFLYLNLRSHPDKAPVDVDENYRFAFLTKEEAMIQSEDENWFRVSKVMDFDNETDVDDYVDEQNLKREEEKMLHRLYRVINSEISYFEETEKSLEKVLNIFIRVNSGGTQLSYSDLLMSILTATFQGDIREKMEQEVDNLAREGFACVTRDHILKTCLMLTNSPHVFKLENFNKENIKKVEDNWDRIVESVQNAVSLISEFGYRSILTSGYIVTTIAYYLYQQGISYPALHDRMAMMHFVRMAQISGYFSTSLDSKLSDIRSIFRKTANFADFMRMEISTIQEWQMNDDQLRALVETVQYGNRAALPLLQVLYPHLKYETVTFHIDHIYPKSKFTNRTKGLPPEYIDKANGLYNLQLLEGTSNGIKKAKDPEVWLAEQYNTEEARRRYLLDNFIPEDFRLEWSNLPEFEEVRKATMFAALRREFSLIRETLCTKQ